MIEYNKRHYHEVIKRGELEEPVRPTLPDISIYKGLYPMFCYNSLLHPLINVSIRGFIWCQGESNAGCFGYNVHRDIYDSIFIAAINGWRALWNDPVMPVYFVQLQIKKDGVIAYTGGGGWAQVRNGQVKTALRLDNTGIAVSNDLPGGLHPGDENKTVVGLRLALNALTQTYGKSLPYCGPLPKSIDLAGNQITISYAHTAGGLVDKTGADLKGFHLVTADAQGKHTAEAATAQISGGTVTIDTQGKAGIWGIEYMYADNPTAELFNNDGFPAAPFKLPVGFSADTRDITYIEKNRALRIVQQKEPGNSPARIFTINGQLANMRPVNFARSRILSGKLHAGVYIIVDQASYKAVQRIVK
jgi:hypothetical protein